jgi:hypothetical protein
VYAFNTNKATTDATIILPTDAWGMAYYRLSYAPITNNYDYDVVIAKENGTIVTLPSIAPFTLNEGEAYRIGLTGDRTGRHITATKPVAYFTHNSFTRVSSGQYAADILFEQMAPVTQWGEKFLVPNAYENTYTSSGVGTNIIRVVASVSGTTVNFPGATRFNTDGNSGVTTVTATSCTLASPGSWVALRISGTVDTNPSCYISADHPVGVGAYMTGAGANSSSPAHNGDPSIAWIPPLNQSVQNALISPFMFLNANDTYLGEATSIHYMIIIAPTGKETLTTVNGSGDVGGLPFHYQNLDRTDITTSAGNLPADAKLNGGALKDKENWKRNDDAGYSYYVWRFTNPTSTTDLKDYLKTFRVENPYGVIVLAGGAGKNETYYYNAGSGTCGVNPNP